MKKILIIMMAIAMAFSFAGCKDKEAAVTEETATTATAENAESTEVNEIPAKEEGVKTVSEEFVNLPDMVEGSFVRDDFSMVLTFYFEDGKAVNGQVVSVYKDIEQAKSVYDSYIKNTEYYANVKREDGKITYTHTESSFAAYKDMSKEEVKASLIEGNFEITKE